MRYFDFDGEFLTPKVAEWYHIPIQELHFYEQDGKHHWFPHLAKNGWFTEDMFWELLEFSKKYCHETNFDKAIYQTAEVFHRRYVFENFDHYKLLNDLNNG